MHCPRFDSNLKNIYMYEPRKVSLSKEYDTCTRIERFDIDERMH